MCRLSWILAAFGLVGCGLIDSSVDDFTLDLPDKEFRIDSTMWGVEGKGAFPAVECPAIDCVGMSTTFCNAPTCMPACGSSGTCEVSTSITLYQMVDLAAERPELAEVDSGPGVDVRIEEVSFLVQQNTFAATYSLPELRVYAGPITAVDPMDTEAERIGTVAPVMGGFTGDGMLVFIDGGQATLERYMSDYRVPFNLMVAGTETVEAGETIPEGMMVGMVTGRATADAL